jgi:glycosyltransferase involved in cell wall biosynthesis
VETAPYRHTVSVVIPVFRGEKTLAAVVDELTRWCTPSVTPAGNSFEVTEIMLVHDNGDDRSDEEIRNLARRYDVVRPVWLSRNYGQHPATLAGMASTAGAWIVTMDEDGQHDPAAIGRMLDVALESGAQLVYADPTNEAPHGRLRNLASATTKWFASTVLTGGRLHRFHSFRLVLGEPGRGVAAYVGPNVYLDVALSWVVQETAYCPVEMRTEGDRRSGYRLPQLLSHFWSLVVSSGTRPLRLVSLLGVVMSVFGFLAAGYVVYRRIADQISVVGWSSVIVAVLVTGGVVLISLGVIAEYVGVAVRMAMGKPIYLIVSDPQDGPLGHPPAERDPPPA